MRATMTSLLLGLLAAVAGCKSGSVESRKQERPAAYASLPQEVQADVDAGEIGAGHQVTAIYEIELERGVAIDDRDELGEIRLRWEDPDTGDITELEELEELAGLEEDDFVSPCTSKTLKPKSRKKIVSN